MKNKKEVYEVLSSLPILSRLVFWTIHSYGAHNSSWVRATLFNEYAKLTHYEPKINNADSFYMGERISSCIRALTKNRLIEFDEDDNDFRYCSVFTDVSFKISMEEYYSLFNDFSDKDNDKIEQTICFTDTHNQWIKSLSESKSKFYKGENVLVRFYNRKWRRKGIVLNGTYSGRIVKKNRTFATIEFDDATVGTWSVRYGGLNKVAV